MASAWKVNPKYYTLNTDTSDPKQFMGYKTNAVALHFKRCCSNIVLQAHNKGFLDHYERHKELEWNYLIIDKYS